MADVHQIGTLTYIGGEMVAWSDFSAERGPAAPGGIALRHVLLGLVKADDKVLVAGPHSEALVADLVSLGAHVTWLLRSVDDAMQVADAQSGVRVLCGSATKLDLEGSFDVVIAADGLDRLMSVEAEPIDAADLQQLIVRAVRPDGGILAQMHDNPVGIHTLVQIPTGGPLDAHWSNQDGPEEHLMSLAQVERTLRTHGFDTLATYSAHPSKESAGVFIGRSDGGVVGLIGPIETALSIAYTRYYARVPVLADPRPLVSRALRIGTDEWLAPAWLTIARMGDGRGVTSVRPVAIVGDEASGTVARISVVDGRAQTDLVVAPTEPPEVAGLRWVGQASRELIVGNVFEDRLQRLCARNDLAGFRYELTRFTRWLETSAQDGLVSGPMAFATPGEVLDDGTRFQQVAANWEPIEPPTIEIVVARSLWKFAVRLVTGTLPHPWDVSSNADDLTVTFMAIIGRTVDSATLHSAKVLQVAYDTAVEGLTEIESDELLLAYGNVMSGSIRVGIVGYRELVEAQQRQRLHIEHLLAMRDWTEKIIGSRDRTLSKMDLQLQLYRKSPFGKFLGLGKLVYQGLRRDGKKVFRKVSGFMHARRGTSPKPSELSQLRTANDILEAERNLLAQSMNAWVEARPVPPTGTILFEAGGTDEGPDDDDE